MQARGTSLAALAIASLLGLVCTSFLNLNPVQISYPTGSRSERDLPSCAEHAVCSVLHRRFWGAPPLVERLCRCAGRLECPATWSKPKDPYSMHLNTRAQLKFCKDIRKLKKCRSGNPSLKITSRHTPPDTLTQTQANVVTMAIASCFCPWPPAPRHWKHKDKDYYKKDYGNGTIEIAHVYSCAKIPRCDHNELCGYVREDLFSSYFHCSCLHGSLCLFSDYNTTHVSEVLFNGPAYTAYCMPYPPIKKIRMS